MTVVPFSLSRIACLVISLSVMSTFSFTARADVNEDIQKAFAEFAKNRTWLTKHGDRLHGELVRIADDKIFLKLDDEIYWIRIPLLVDAQQLLVHDFETELKEIRGAARPFLAAETLNIRADPRGFDIENLGNEQDLRIWTDQNNKTMKARLTSIDRFMVRTDFEGLAITFPTWALSNVDIEYLRGVSEVDREFSFPAPIDIDAASAKIESLSQSQWRIRIGKVVRSAAAGPEDLAEAKRWLSNIQSKSASKSLARVCRDERTLLPLRIAALESLSRFDAKEAHETLAEIATTTESASLRNAAKLGLKSLPRQSDALHGFQPLLKNEVTRRAAYDVIAELGLLSAFETKVTSENRPVRSPEFLDTLIDALFKTDSELKKVMVGYDTGRVPTAGGWRRSAGYKERHVRTPLRTPQPVIYETLKGYSGEDFGYNQNAWYEWAKSQKNASAFPNE
ncbi:MAG: HEAT repeat domain-containing protein [Planctomycetota bacterium]